MFLIRVIDLMALIGLFVQTFVAWVFVILLLSLQERGERRDPVRAFAYAFLALALSLSAMSVRFFRAHDELSSYEFWADGALPATICYSLYMALKTLFGTQLIRGCYELWRGAEPSWMRAVRWPAVVVAGTIPWGLPQIGDLLLVQAGIMVVCSLHALRVLMRKPTRDLCLVCWALGILAGSWVVHALAVLGNGRWGTGYILSFGSFIDLAVQLFLGVGLVVGLMRDAHSSRLRAERERERLEKEAARDARLLALGRVVSGVAHELNNPLTVISGHSELLARKRPDDRSVRVISEQAQRCRGIVRSLSALAGQKVHPRRREDLEELARRVVRGLAPDLLAEGRYVRIAPMPGLRCNVDRIGIEQVLANLVTNALQASPPEGGVEIGGADEGEAVTLTVADRGEGVPEEIRERLFEPFFTTKEPGEGTGLGLSIAHAIVHAHGGTIEVRPQPQGPGSIFRVRLVDSEPSVEESAESSAAPADRRLLIVDDEEAVRFVVRQHAELRGWRVLEASSAEQALALLDRCEVVLCDLRMPGIGGIGLHDRLAAESPERLDRVLFFTGDLASEEAVGFAARCRRPLLPKPLEFDRLWPQIDASVENRA